MKRERSPALQEHKGGIKRERGVAPGDARSPGTFLDPAQPSDNIVVALEAMLVDGTVSVPPATLLHLVCRPEADTLVAELAVRVLSRQWMDPFCDVDAKAVVALVGHVAAHDASRAVLLQVLRSMTQVLQTRALPDLAAALFRLALDRTTDARGAVRAGALRALCSVAQPQWCEDAQLLTGLADFALRDGDAFARAAAMEGLLALHARACAVLPLSLWPVAVAALDDGADSVREAAVSLTGVLALLYGSDAAPGADQVSVMDRAFVLLCNAVNDATLSVRCRAAGLLGSLDGVNQLVLLSSLSKKPQPGTSGAPLAADASAWSLDHQAVPGAFVHALEEEYWEVRSAALHSICEISLRDQEFARCALDYVVDMLHDENSAVRLNAIHSLRRMGALGPSSLRADHLAMLHFLLSEDSTRIRKAVQQLLREVVHPDAACFQATVQSLLVNLVRYPADTDAVVAALAGLGRSHPDLCELLVETLLRIDRRFVLQERSVSDPVYQATLVLLFSSGRTELLPAYALRHREFIAARWAAVFDRALPADATIVEPANDAQSVELFANIDGALALFRDGSAAAADALIASAVAFASPGSFAALLSSAVHAWMRLRRGVGDPTLLTRELQESSLVMEHAFSGLSLRLQHDVRQLRLPSWDPTQMVRRFEMPQRSAATLRLERTLASAPQLLSVVALPLELTGVARNVTDVADLALLAVYPDCSWSVTPLLASDFAPGDAPLAWVFAKRVLLRFAPRITEPLNVHVWLVRRVADAPALVVGVTPRPKGIEALGAAVALHDAPLLFPLLRTLQ